MIGDLNEAYVFVIIYIAIFVIFIEQILFAREINKIKKEISKIQDNMIEIIHLM